MGLAPLLQVVIGLVFVYLLMSILCSGINELLAQKFSRRGNFLKLGLHNILGDRWMYLRLVNHPLIATLYREHPGKKLRHPSYIPAGNFALALVEVVRLKAKQLGVDVAPDEKGCWSVPDLKKAAAACESYGYYVGTALVPLLTKDSTAAPAPTNATIFRQCLANTVAEVKSGSWMTKLVGWALTVLAVTLGTPFWFDLLNRVVNLRSSGRRPVASTTTPPVPADK